jgi:hypothetical protein
VTGDCVAGRHGFRLTEAARVVEPLEAPVVDCVDGRPELRLGAFSEALGSPRPRLAPLLPAALAAASDRAVWTGEALLVARASNGEAVIRRHVCRGGTLESD